MRFIMLLTAFILMVLIAVQFAGDARPIRPFENSTVYIVCGNDSRETIGSAILDAARSAEQDLGCAVEIIYTDWDTDVEVTQVRQLLTTTPGGILVMGYPAHEALGVALNDAIDMEVPVTAFNTPIEPLQVTYGPFGLGYAGINSLLAGKDLAAAAVKKHAIGPGSRVLLLGDLDHPARAPFVQGVSEVFENAGATLERLAVSTRTLHLAPEETRAEFQKRNAQNDLPDLVCFTEIPLWLASNLLAEAGLRPGQVPLIGLGANMFFDEQRASHVSLMVGQDLGLQVYMSIVQVALYTSFRHPGLTIHLPYKILGNETGPDPLSPADGRRFVVLE